MKRRDDQITIRLAGTLRQELEREAAKSGRGLSHEIRKILIDYMAQRLLADEAA
jgi:hypothetical protein